MQYVNDDMDELLRRAAREYPLDTSSADWNKVAVALQKEEVPESRSGKGRFLWLLMLLPLALVCNYFFTGDNSLDRDKTGNAANSTTVEAGSKPLPNSKEIHVDKRSASEYIKPESKESIAIQKNESDAIHIHSDIVFENYSRSTDFSKPGSDRNASPGMENSSEHNLKSDENANPGIHSYEEDQRLSRVTYIPPGEEKLINLNSPAAVNRSVTAITERNLPAFRKKFYAGVAGGVDATSVKWQKIESLGFEYGVLAGYQFSRKFSVETGLFMNRKFYYTDGEHFNTSKIYLPPNTTITEVSGYCNMFEVPVKIKYEISSRNSSSWFATAGISSYFMKKEDYDYVYYYGSSGTLVTHNATYTNSSRNLFSVARISAGYTHKLGRFGDVRIEPYMKLPLKKVGYGEMSLISSGIHVGIFPDIF